MAFIYIRLGHHMIRQLTVMYAVQFSIRSAKMRAGSMHRDCGLCMIGFPDTEVCLCFPIYERCKFNLILYFSTWKPGFSVIHLPLQEMSSRYFFTYAKRFVYVLTYLPKLDSLFLIVLHRKLIRTVN